MVYAVIAMNSVNAEVPLVSLLGDNFAADPNGFAGCSATSSWMVW